MRDLIEDLKDALDESAIDVDAVAGKFLSVVSQKDKNLAKKWLGVLLPAYVKGEIYGSDYKEAKFVLGRIVDDAYKEKTKHFWVGRGGDNPESDFEWWLGSPSNLHELISKKKKLDKAKPTTTISKHSGRKLKEVDPTFVNIAREFIDATHPVALIVKELKTKVTKGKKPDPAVQAKRAAQLAKKDMKTCACCFRSIARLKNGKIADHGYELPEKWMKTASCPGRRFRPLEVSDDGLKFMVKQLKSRVGVLEKSLGTTPKTIHRKKNWKGEVETLTPDHPKWGEALRIHIANLKQELKRTEDDLASYQHKLDHWKPVAD